VSSCDAEPEREPLELALEVAGIAEHGMVDVHERLALAGSIPSGWHCSVRKVVQFSVPS
jgi:hypothetical protein